MTDCARQDCDRRATHYVELRVPAQGFDMRSAARLLVGLVMCRDHANDFNVPAFVDGPGRVMIEAEFTNRGLVKPDLERAESDVRRVGDATWRKFQSERAAQAGGGQA